MGSSRSLAVSITTCSLIPPRSLRSATEETEPQSISTATLLLRRQHPIDHLAGEAEIVGGIAHLLELLAADVPGNLLVGGKEVDQRLAACRRLAADVVDEVVRALAAEVRSEPHHHLFGDDRTAGQVEVGAHARGVDLQTFHDIAGLPQRAGAEQEDLRQCDPLDLPR